MDRHTEIIKTKLINFSDKTTIKRLTIAFAREYNQVDIEHALVITPNGIAYELSGIAESVNPEVIGADQLRNSIIVHNHPVLAGEIMGDSFSLNDILLSVRNKVSKQYLVSGVRRNTFVYSGSLSEKEIWLEYKKARNVMLERAFSREADIDWEREEIIKILAEKLKGFDYYDYF